MLSLGKILIVAGVFLAYVGFTVFNGTYEEKTMVQDSIVVEATIQELPDCRIISSKRSFCKLSYNNIIHILKCGQAKCKEFQGKDKVKVLTNKTGTKIIFMDSYDPSDFVFSFILFALGVVLLFKGVVSEIQDYRS